MGSRIAPDWPRMMRRSTAALYCDMPVAEFERGVSRGTLPQPVKVVDELRWSRTQLDEYLERLTGDAIPDFRKKSKLYAA
jgi:predicted DNA-binding transcriptional regulator AlpA